MSSGTFVKHNLPSPQAYYEAEGLVLQPGGQRCGTTRCEFHGGSDSMRVHLGSGAFVCMAGCGARGGDVLAYHMAAHGMGFVEAAKALGAWQGQPAQANGPGRRHHHYDSSHRRPPQPSPRSALAMVREDLLLCAILISDALRGRLTREGHARLCQAAGRCVLWPKWPVSPRRSFTTMTDSSNPHNPFAGASRLARARAEVDAAIAARRRPARMTNRR